MPYANLSAFSDHQRKPLQALLAGCHMCPRTNHSGEMDLIGTTNFYPASSTTEAGGNRSLGGLKAATKGRDEGNVWGGSAVWQQQLQLYSVRQTHEAGAYHNIYGQLSTLVAAGVGCFVGRSPLSMYACIPVEHAHVEQCYTFLGVYGDAGSVGTASITITAAAH
ncbi:hypothetical protein HaLaN_12142 [Haematococcus lacustris]|uniref:Uncharacterized protein n=1 Tax=Haematococcus lacustris TaxID=44745 RepID=A0A699Z2Q9_HAELA|nr:hypothetical protein HaLaN_12142 [Haematococcus lacustris]